MKAHLITSLVFNFILISFVSCKDSINVNYIEIFREIQKETLYIDENNKTTHRWIINTNKNGSKHIKDSTLEIFQNKFIRLKGFNEGLFKGFYRNTALE